MSRKTLAIELSKLSGFQEPKEKVEQYESDPEVIAEVLWHLHMRDEIPERVADFGAGTGILGIGFLLLGKHVTFLENDISTIAVLKHNLQEFKNYDIVTQDVRYNMLDYDMIVMNPPFGTRRKGADTEFLINAFSHTNKILSIHLASTKQHVKQLIAKNGFVVEFEMETEFQLKNTLEHHKRQNHKISVLIVYSKKAL